MSNDAQNVHNFAQQHQRDEIEHYGAIAAGAAIFGFLGWLIDLARRR